MGTKRMSKSERAEMEADVQHVRGNASKLDARQSAENVVAKLSKGEGYFIWTAFKGTERVKVWLLRRPRLDRPDAAWLKNEKCNIVHLCRPIPLWEAVANGEKDRTVAHSGYVNEEGKCVRCDRECDTTLFKKLRGLVKMFEIERRTT